MPPQVTQIGGKQGIGIIAISPRIVVGTDEGSEQSRAGIEADVVLQFAITTYRIAAIAVFQQPQALGDRQHMLDTSTPLVDVGCQHLILGGKDQIGEVIDHTLPQLGDIRIRTANTETEHRIALRGFQLLDGAATTGHPLDASSRRAMRNFRAGTAGLLQQRGIITMCRLQAIGKRGRQTQHRQHPRTRNRHAPGIATEAGSGQWLVTGQKAGEQVGNKRPATMRRIGGTGKVQATPTRRALERVVLQHQADKHGQPRACLPQRFDEVKYRTPLLRTMLRTQGRHPQGMQAIFDRLNHLVDAPAGGGIGIFAFSKAMPQGLREGFIRQGSAHLRIAGQALQATDHEVHRHLHLQMLHRFIDKSTQTRGGLLQCIGGPQQALYGHRNHKPVERQLFALIGQLHQALVPQATIQSRAGVAHHTRVHFNRDHRFVKPPAPDIIGVHGWFVGCGEW